MIKNVVYILGAGFSAPLGIPVMSDFLTRAKYMYAGRKDVVIEGMFKEVDRLDKAKRFFSLDLFNIEEVLSILTMESKLGNQSPAVQQAFQRLIAEVITNHTPQLPPLAADGHVEMSQSFPTVISESEWNPYTTFVANLIGMNIVGSPIKWEGPPHRTFRIDGQATRPANNVTTEYSVITLNYDLIIEHLTEFFHSMTQHTLPVPGVATSISENPSKCWEFPYPLMRLAKLHGTAADPKTIVPPTWDKNVSPQILKAWRLAYELLSQANEIRIIGYSLPAADAYVHYLLKSAVLNTTNLHAIDVICHDPDGSVKARYDQFMDNKRYRFVNGLTQDYLGHVAREGFTPKTGPANVLTYSFLRLEEAHKSYMRDVLTA
jgi:hypothetical protein